MSELQDALDRWDLWDDDNHSLGKAHPFWPLVEAARRVVNPDAATERVLNRMGMHQHTQRDWDRAYELACAALGITEDTE